MSMPMKRAAPNSGTRWFTVSEAAQALDVGEDQIFDGIRGGRIRVRFEPVPGADTERPLVTSDEIERKADVQGFTEGELKGPTERRPPQSGATVSPAAASYSREEIEGLKQELTSAEDKLDHSLRSLYERDVKIARLEAELQAAAKVETAAHQYSQRLEERLSRVETASEDKEREIRRLALTLGEARGEVKLLRGPVDGTAAKPRSRHWRTALVVALAVVGGLAIFHFARTQQSLEAAVAAGLVILLTPVLTALIAPSPPR
jgi:hypothetical protein